MFGRLSTKLPIYAKAFTTTARNQRQANQLSTTTSTSTSTRLFQQPSNTTITKSKTKTKSTRNPKAITVTTNQKSSSNNSNNNEKVINLHTIPLEELEEVIISLGHPKYRAKQVYNWVRVQGVTDVAQMNNIPKQLKDDLERFAAVGCLTLDMEEISKDGTKKRAYRLADGQLIESVLMPYTDGRYTACISSQAGCAQGCVFCATGQMGFSRQLTSDEIFEQVARFASELSQQDQQEKKELKKQNNNGKGQMQEHYNRNQQQKTSGRSTRLSNLVFMGMGEPLANYQNVKKAIQRIQSELGIGHRKITVSTVGIVPNIYKMAEELPQVRLAVSLHCANDEERSDLLPANKRYGGLKELMTALQDYISNTGKRVTLEWALIEGENDTPETAHELGKLIKKWLRKDMVHINVIPLNPTGGFGGSPSGRQRVNAFCAILEDRYGVACTPRVRRGIDINAGCGQLKAEVEKKQRSSSKSAQDHVNTQAVEEAEELESDLMTSQKNLVDDSIEVERDLQFALDELAIEMSDEEDWEDYEYQSDDELAEANRLIDLVKGSTITAENQVIGTPDTAAKP